MIPLRMASIGGFSSSRGSMFHVSATDSFNLGSPAMPSSAVVAAQPFLGQSAEGQDIYNEGKKQIAIYDDLVERTKRIANKTVRDQIIADYGLTEPANKDKSLYMRNATANSIAKADSYTPVNYRIFVGPGPDKNRPRKLAEWNDDFASAVKEAEVTYGTLPEPVVIEHTTTLSQTPAWVLPVTIGALAIAGLAAFGVFSGK